MTRVGDCVPIAGTTGVRVLRIDRHAAVAVGAARRRALIDLDVEDPWYSRLGEQDEASRTVEIATRTVVAAVRETQSGVGHGGSRAHDAVDQRRSPYDPTGDRAPLNELPAGQAGSLVVCLCVIGHVRLPSTARALSVGGGATAQCPVAERRVRDAPRPLR